MKTQSQWIQKGMVAGLLASTMILGIGCASKKGDDPAPPPADGGGVVPVTPTTEAAIANRGAEFTEGATAPLTVTYEMLNRYVGTHPVNNPSDVRISVKLYEITPGANQYAGRVMISYYDNGQYYTGRFITDDGKNPTGSPAQSGTLYPGWNHAFYNNWFTWNGKAAFHGFYEDSYGAIMLIADEIVNLGDGSGATEVSGSIWFKNFANSPYPRANPSLPCWYTTAAAFDCRTLLIDGNNGDGHIKSDSALYPTQSQFYTNRQRNPYIPEEPARGWQKLGTFGGLNRPKAFSN
jgi:hypothetical protein